MRAVQIGQFGGPEVIKVVSLSRPEPGPGEVRVKMAYAGVNFSDIYRREGNYARSPTYPTQLPLVLGLEGSGTVDAIAPDVSGFQPGDRVAFTRNLGGAYAEYCLVSADRLVHVPAALALDIAAAAINQGMTAHYLSHEFGLKLESTCLVHAGAGGVGTMLIQLAKLKGATVFTTVGSRDKADTAKSCGADHVILYREKSFRDEVRRLTDGQGVDIVYDTVGKDTFVDSLHCLRVRGMCVLVGNSSGLVGDFDPMELAEAGSVFLTRPHMQHYVKTPEEYAWRANDVFRWIEEGILKVKIGHKFSLEKAVEAHRLLAARQTSGKLLLAIDEHP